MRGRQSPERSMGAGSRACPTGLPDLWAVDLLTWDRATSLCFQQGPTAKAKVAVPVPESIGESEPFCLRAKTQTPSAGHRGVRRQGRPLQTAPMPPAPLGPSLGLPPAPSWAVMLWF